MRKVLCFLSLCVFCAVAQNTTGPSDTTTAISSPCRNGGVCVGEISVDCTCKCDLQFFGRFCENTFTKINGYILYNFLQAIPGANINAAELRSLILSALNSALSRNYTLELNKPTFNATHLTVGFSFYFMRPLDWTNYNDSEVLLNSLQSRLSETASLNAVFVSSNGISLASLDLDVDECASNWTNCYKDSYCVNRERGFTCICGTGLEGDGIECLPITCALSDAPEPPSLGSRKFYDSNGTEILDIISNLPFGTSIQYSCVRYYELVDVNGNSIGLQSIACQSGGWGQVEDSSCATELGFKVAIGISAVSSLIIIVAVGAFVTHYCLQQEKKERSKNTGETSRDRLSEHFDSL